jgi:hypothetical protein
MLFYYFLSGSSGKECSNAFLCCACCVPCTHCCGSGVAAWTHPVTPLLRLLFSLLQIRVKMVTADDEVTTDMLFVSNSYLCCRSMACCVSCTHCCGSA